MLVTGPHGGKYVYKGVFELVGGKKVLRGVYEHDDFSGEEPREFTDAEVLNMFVKEVRECGDYDHCGEYEDFDEFILFAVLGAGESTDDPDDPRRRMDEDDWDELYETTRSKWTVEDVVLDGKIFNRGA